MDNTIFMLESENLTALGGPMGSEYTWVNWRKHFSTLAKAKAAAEKDFKGNIDWIETRYGVRSPDLRYVMYHIRKIQIDHPLDPKEE